MSLEYFEFEELKNIFVKREKSLKVIFIVESIIQDRFEGTFEGPKYFHYYFNKESSELFHKITTSMKLNEDDYFILQIGDDKDKLIALLKQLSISVVITLGAKAFNMLLDNNERLSRVHGQIFPFDTGSKKFNLIPLFHPDFLIINPNMKRLCWQDVQNIMQLI